MLLFLYVVVVVLLKLFGVDFVNSVVEVGVTVNAGVGFVGAVADGFIVVNIVLQQQQQQRQGQQRQGQQQQQKQGWYLVHPSLEGIPPLVHWPFLLLEDALFRQLCNTIIIIIKTIFIIYLYQYFT